MLTLYTCCFQSRTPLSPASKRNALPSSPAQTRMNMRASLCVAPNALEVRSRVCLHMRPLPQTHPSIQVFANPRKSTASPSCVHYYSLKYLRLLFVTHIYSSLSSLSLFWSYKRSLRYLGPREATFRGGFWMSLCKLHGGGRVERGDHISCVCFGHPYNVRLVTDAQSMPPVVEHACVQCCRKKDCIVPMPV